MPTPKKGARIGGSPAHQRLIMANLATSLFEHGRITTTEAKARVLRPVAERLITKAKKGDLHNRRQVLATIKDKGVVHTLFTEIAPRFAERPGGYTRITKIGPRKGDNAPMAVIELVTEEYTPKPKAERKPAASAASAPAAAAEAPVETQADSADAADAAEVSGAAEAAEVEAPATEGAPAEVEAPAAATDETEVVAVEGDTASAEAVSEAEAPADEAAADEDETSK